MEKLYIELAIEGYKAYSLSTGNKNFMGDEMPKWEDLPEKIKNAWVAAAKKIREEVIST